ncbi:E3 ubiquitin/ISG15 ligase TRIM25-like [Phyllobates terribilis]|uniref:E3 ubiquitin/ISG15 ligase TRIM25-like n=1 Tax=Phyllobates terribilis TaxID=111132 RepID=UPI003CCB5748
MASADLNDVICSICRDIHTDPVNLQCGHIFCWDCMDNLLNTQEEYGLYSCPECKVEFKESPALQIKLRKSPVSEELETMIFCTYCIYPTVCAVKFCALCEAFLCSDHLTVHTKSAEHVLSEPCTIRQSKKCSIHKKVLQYYCTEDNVSICEVCCNGEHRGHQTEDLPKATTKQKLKNALEDLTTMNAETDARVQNLQQHLKNVHEKANDAAEKVTSMLLYTRTQLEDLEKRILSEILTQREKMSHSVSGLIQNLEIKRSDRLRKISRIGEVYKMANPMSILENQELYQDNICSFVEEDQAKVSKLLLSRIGRLDEVLITLTLHLGFQNIMTSVKRDSDMEEPTGILLDINTAGHSVHVSGDRKTASRSEVNLQRTEMPQRFQGCQVLSTTSFSSGRHYWEMETSKWTWKIGVCYPSMDRRGSASNIGNNMKSWCLTRWYNTNQYRATHNSEDIKIDLETACHQFGIYLDYDAGQLSFYALCNPIRHLHTFSAAFTEPLHAAFWVWGFSMLYKEIWVRITRYEKF